MVKDNPADFICPGCQARYKIVRAKAEFTLPRCAPLAAMDGENILKYFLISRPKARQSQAQPRLVTTGTPADL
jgi:hypothetical protein